MVLSALTLTRMAGNELTKIAIASVRAERELVVAKLKLYEPEEEDAFQKDIRHHESASEVNLVIHATMCVSSASKAVFEALEKKLVVLDTKMFQIKHDTNFAANRDAHDVLHCDSFVQVDHISTEFALHQSLTLPYKPVQADVKVQEATAALHESELVLNRAKKGTHQVKVGALLDDAQAIHDAFLDLNPNPNPNPNSNRNLNPNPSIAQAEYDALLDTFDFLTEDI